VAGPNISGKPRTSDYTLGRGKVFFAEIDTPTGLPMGFRDLGNAPEFNVSSEVETLEHQSSQEGLKVTDKEVTISQKLNIALTLDEINSENLAFFFSGEKQSIVNPAVAGITARIMVPAGQVETGRWYQIRNAAGVRVVNIKTSSLTFSGTVPSGGGASPTYATSLFEIDNKWGRFFIPTTSTSVNLALGIVVTLAADGDAVATINTVAGLTKTAVQGALLFIAENPAANDEQSEYQFHQVSLKADGDFALIGDEFSQMAFTAVAERNVLADPTAPTMRFRHYEQA